MDAECSSYIVRRTPPSQYEDNGVVVRFIDPDQDPQQESFLPFVNCCLIDLLTFIYELLGIANESTIRPKVLLVLKELARGERRSASSRTAK